MILWLIIGAAVAGWVAIIAWHWNGQSDADAPQLTTLDRYEDRDGNPL